jgi:hypothetical protein
MSPPAQAFLGKSKSSVPEASVGSVAASPVILSRSQSFGCSAHLAPSTVAGSCLVSHRRIGPAIPGDGRLPSGAVMSGGNPSYSPASPPARRSSHKIAGRSGRPSPAASTTPCICPVTASPTISVPPPAPRPTSVSRLTALPRASRTATLAACHQSSGSVSACPSAGTITG